MRITMFIKDRMIYIALAVFVTLFSALLLYMVEATAFFTLFVPCTYLAGCAAALIIEYFTKARFYENLLITLEELDQKTLLSEIISKPNFYEGRILYDILQSTNKAMNDEIAKYILSSAEYREYIELWVHEIKTPIAGAKLICENIGNQSMLDSLQKIEKFVEQALFYSRSNAVEKDFLIKQISLQSLLNRVLRKNAKYYIDHKISIEVSDLDVSVFTDTKWMDFILQQILDNAVK